MNGTSARLLEVRTMWMIFRASPKPMSPSTNTGSPLAHASCRIKRQTSSTVMMPRFMAVAKFKLLDAVSFGST
jgi:hypothetical protein